MRVQSVGIPLTVPCQSLPFSSFPLLPSGAFSHNKPRTINRDRVASFRYLLLHARRFFHRGRGSLSPQGSEIYLCDLKDNTDSGNDIPIETQSQIRPQALDFKLGHYPTRLSPDSRRLGGVTIR